MTKTHARALHFKHARSNRLAEIAEDYTELIADILERQASVHICDIAKEMGISHVSVLRTIRRLVSAGLILKKESIELTDKGKEMAKFSKKKHLILTEFLLSLGIPEEVVASDVEGIEHYISKTTLEAIAAQIQPRIEESQR